MKTLCLVCETLKPLLPDDFESGSNFVGVDVESIQYF